MTHNPANPFDLRSRDEPVLEMFEFAVAGDLRGEHATRIEKLLSGVNGVLKVEAHATEERVEVTYDARRTNPAAIHEYLKVQGYDAARWTEV